MENTNKLIELKGISVSFDGEKILDNLHKIAPKLVPVYEESAQ